MATRGRNTLIFIFQVAFLFGVMGTLHAQDANEFMGLDGSGGGPNTQANEFQGLGNTDGSNAAGGPEAGDPVGGPEAGDPGAGSGSCGNSPTGLVNPLQVCSVGGFLLAVLDILLVFALPIVVFFIIYAGFKFVTAQGDTGKLSEARSAFLWAVVGGVIVLGANLIVNVIQGTVNSL